MKPKPKTAGKFCEGFAQLWKSSFISYFLEYSPSLRPSISRVCGWCDRLRLSWHDIKVPGPLHGEKLRSCWFLDTVQGLNSLQIQVFPNKSKSTFDCLALYHQKKFAYRTENPSELTWINWRVSHQKALERKQSPPRYGISPPFWREISQDAHFGYEIR